VSVRLFVAIDIDAATRAAAAGVIQRVERRLRADVKWVAPENLHITVQFIGHVGDADAERIRAAMAPPLAVRPFAIRVAALGAFPPRGGPRVIWCGVEGADRELAAVHGEVAGRLKAAAAVEPEARPFRAHLTIGRYRTPGRAADRTALGAIEVGLLGTPAIDHITLYESRLSPRGPTYTPLVRTPLSGTIPSAPA
jgi:2'-5' RNA ligase